MNLRKYIIIMILFASLCNLCLAQAVELRPASNVNISSHLKKIDDNCVKEIINGNEECIENIILSTNDYLFEPIMADSYSYYFELENTTKSHLKKIITFSNGSLDKVVYQDVSTNNTIIFNELLPIEDREVGSINCAIPINLEPEEKKKVILTISQSGVKMRTSVYIKTLNSHLIFSLKENTLLSMILGFELSMVLLSLVLVFILKNNRTFTLFFMLYKIGMFLFLIDYKGHLTILLLPYLQQFEKLAIMLPLIIANSSFAFLSIGLFQIKIPTWIKYFNLILFVSIFALSLDFNAFSSSIRFLLLLFFVQIYFIPFYVMFAFPNSITKLLYLIGSLNLFLMGFSKLFFIYLQPKALFFDTYGMYILTLLESILFLALILYESIKQFQTFQKAKLTEKELIIQKKESLENERSRIAGEMHDNLGGGLTLINYLSNKIDALDNKDKIKALSRDIKDSSLSLVDSISEIVWAMNPKFDDIRSLVSYIRRHSTNYLDNFNVTLVFRQHIIDRDLFISAESRRNLTLIVKEILHNVIKHANAKKVEIHITQSVNLSLIISDNGDGFDNSNISSGQGLKNIQRRCSDIGGSLEINSINGTTYNISIPLISD